MSELNYVMAFITKDDLPITDFSGNQEWLMVKHKSRGWELPGGKIQRGEDPEEAIIREVFEEAGITSYVREGPYEYEDGLVFWMGASPDSNLHLKSSNDPIISEINWFNAPPKNLAWGLVELQNIINLFK